MRNIKLEDDDNDYDEVTYVKTALRQQTKTKKTSHSSRVTVMSVARKGIKMPIVGAKK